MVRKMHKNLKTYLSENLNQTEADQRLLLVIYAIVESVKQVAIMVEQAPLAGQLGKLIHSNIQGEQQAKLDVLSNNCFVANLQACEAVAGLVSEEVDDAILLARDDTKSNYLVVFDPIDGSSNIEVNVAVGSIFSALKAPVGRAAQATDFLVKGAEQVFAGYAIYGPSLVLVLTIGAGTQCFTFNRTTGEFILTQANLRVPDDTQEFAINASNARFWEPPIEQYVQECQAGTTGVRGKDFNMRWIASMVSDVHRILMRGGVYLYPKDNKVPIKAGRLRLLYELNPMSMVIEQAGGAASTGRAQVLELKPTDIHQRGPIIIGSKNEVERIRSYHQDFDQLPRNKNNNPNR
ncbi:MAG: class 1 fructose-bisphosphatase [Bdellovibrio sp.]|nr:class 1 fructose-bisphosphatase [Methylotenera sp.]